MQTYRVGNLKVRGQVQAGKINVGVVNGWMEFKTTSNEELTKTVSADRSVR